MKNKALTVAFLVMATVVTLAAQSVKLGWDAYPTNDTSVTTIRVYGVKGTNTVFAAGNTNATLLASTAVANTTLSVSNLAAGAWTFTATAYSTNGVESLNSNTVWTNVYPGAVVNFRFAP